MAVDRKPVTIHYRKFNKATTVTNSLEDIIRQAMNSTSEKGIQIKDRYTLRLLTVASDNYFINTYSDGNGSTPLVFGDILHFTKRHLQALCKTADENAASVPVQQLRAPEQSEYVHSQMFWMVKGDHAFIIQSMSLRTTELEQYLSWLLTNKTSHFQQGNTIILDSKFDEDEIGGDLSDIQEIIIGGIAAPSSTVLEEETVDQVREITRHGQIDTGRRAGWATATAILRELLGGEANVESLMKTVPPDAELNVRVHIGFQTKKRKIDRVALKQLETGLRNLPDSQLQVKSKGARTTSDGMIRLHHNASIRLIKALDGENQIIGTLLDPADVLRAMVEAYTMLMANGKIQQ